MTSIAIRVLVPFISASLSDRLSLTILSLCAALAARCARDRGLAPVGVLLWGRRRRIGVRFETLFARWQAGRLPPLRPRERAPRPGGERVRYPGGAWMIRHVPGSAVFGMQLQHLLAEPEMAAFLAQVPRAGRLLRPLCRLLGVPFPAPPVRTRPSPPPDQAPRRVPPSTPGGGPPDAGPPGADPPATAPRRPAAPTVQKSA